MAPAGRTVGQIIAARAKRDPEFKRQVLSELRTQLAGAKPRTEHWQHIDKAIHALEDMK